MVRESVQCGQIILKTPKGEATEAQATIIENIIQLVANYSPVDCISRMVKLN